MHHLVGLISRHTDITLAKLTRVSIEANGVPMRSTAAVGGTEQGLLDDPPTSLSPILSAALEEFVEHGYDGTSVRTIAARVGVTVPAIYYHHENKQALLVDLLDRAMDIARARVFAAADGAGDEPRDRLGAVVQALVLFMVEHSGLAVLHTDQRSLTPANRDRYHARRKELEDLLQDCVQRGVDSGDFRCSWVAESTRAILSMCHGVAGWYKPAGRHTARTIARRHVELALAMVGADSQPGSKGASRT